MCFYYKIESRQERRGFSRLHNVQINSGVQPTSYSVNTGVISRGECGRAWRKPNHSCPSSVEVKFSKAIPLLPLWLTAWTGISVPSFEEIEASQVWQVTGVWIIVQQQRVVSILPCFDNNHSYLKYVSRISIKVDLVRFAILQIKFLAHDLKKIDRYVGMRVCR